MLARPPKFTEKQRAFCREFIIDRNAKRAAVRAGYSPKTAQELGYELLRKDHILAEIDRRNALIEVRSEITLRQIMAELAKIGFSNPEDFLKRVDGKWVVNDAVQLDRDHMAAVKKIKLLPDGAAELEFHDKNKALIALGQHLGLRTRPTDDAPPSPLNVNVTVGQLGIVESVRRIVFALYLGGKAQSALDAQQTPTIDHAEAAE